MTHFKGRHRVGGGLIIWPHGVEMVMRTLEVTPEILCEVSNVEKHLPGQHDQKTHGRKKGKRLVHEIQVAGGFTYDPASGRTPQEGFALSVYPEHEKVIDASLPPEDLARQINQYLEDNKEIWNRPDHYVGGWHDVESGKIYLDISIVVNDNETARRLAVKHGQEGYYDLGKGETVIVKRPEERRKSAEALEVFPVAQEPNREGHREFHQCSRGEGTTEVEKETIGADRVGLPLRAARSGRVLKEITEKEVPGEGETGGERAARFWQENWHKLYPKSGKGRFVLHEHWMGLSKDEVKLPREELIRRGHSFHSDLRLESDGGLHGWTVFLGKAENNATNRLLALPPDDNLQVAPKVVQPKGWLGFEGVSEPGEVGATAGKYARFDIVDSGTYEVGVWREHMMEYFFHGKKLRGRLLVQYAPLGRRRVWIIDRPEDQRPYAETRALEDVVKELKDKGQKWLIWRKLGEKPRLIDVGAFEFEKAASRRIVPIAKVDLARQIVYGIVLDPYIVDSQGDWVPVLEVEKAAHGYLVKSRTIGDQHQRKADAELVESWLVPYPTPEDYQKAIAGEPHKAYQFKFGGSEVHSGAWVVGIHVISKQLWKEVQSGVKTGLSIGAVGERIRDVKQTLLEFEAVEPEEIPVFVTAR